MIKKCYLVASLLLLMAAVAGPSLVSAEGDHLASPTPLPPERVTAPEIFGINPNVVLSEGNQGETLPSDILPVFNTQLTFLVDLPEYVQLKPQSIKETRTIVKSLAIPLRTQDASKVTCGLQALGMVMDFIGPSSGEAVPTDGQLVSYISSQGLLYEWGTGVEELAYTAREFGYAGSYAFHNWTLKQLTEQLHLGKPVIVSLGANGENKPGHFVTVSGISDDGRWVFYNDPLLGRMTVPADEFLVQWNLQGNAGLIVEKETLPAAVDPMLPWMGLFSALSMLTLVAGKSGISESSRVFDDLRRKLSDPKRKGIGGGLTAPVILKPDTKKGPRYETKTVYRGLKTVKLEIPVYETKKVKVGIRGYKKKVPIYETRRVQVGFKTVPKKIPEYTTKRVKVGTKTIKQKIPVTRYRNSKAMQWKKTTRMVPVYRTIGSRRIMTGTRKETRWKKVPVMKRVPYQSTKVIFRQVSEYRDVKVLRGYRTVMEKVPKYELKKIIVGYKTVNVTEPVYEEQQIRVGTKITTRQVPDYQVVQIPVRDDDIPRQGEEELELTKEELRLIEKLTEKPDAAPSPPTGFSSDVWKNLSRETQLKILSGGSAVENISETVDDAEKGWWIRTLEGIHDKFIEPVEHYKKNPDELLKVINPEKLPKLLSISARESWDFDILTQEGVVAGTYVPPGLLKVFYMKQKLNIEQKAVLTINPGSLINYDITTAKGSLKLSKNISYIFGPGEMGFSIKNSKEEPMYDYTVKKHSIQASLRGWTYKYKEEGVWIDKKKSSEDFQTKLVSTLKCDTKTIKTEGILILALVATLGFELAISPFGVDLYDRILSGAFSGIK